jgi:hypothetical protein
MQTKGEGEKIYKQRKKDKGQPNRAIRKRRDKQTAIRKRRDKQTEQGREDMGYRGRGSRETEEKTERAESAQEKRKGKTKQNQYRRKKEKRNRQTSYCCYLHILFIRNRMCKT